MQQGQSGEGHFSRQPAAIEGPLQGKQGSYRLCGADVQCGECIRIVIHDVSQQSRIHLIPDDESGIAIQIVELGQIKRLLGLVIEEVVLFIDPLPHPSIHGIILRRFQID